jgi:hypothetical protein
MLNTDLLPWLFGGWLATLTAVVTIGVAMGANLSTIAFLLALAAAPAVVMALVKRGEAGPTVAEILHAVHTHDVRR